MHLPLLLFQGFNNASPSRDPLLARLLPRFSHPLRLFLLSKRKVYVFIFFSRRPSLPSLGMDKLIYIQMFVVPFQLGERMTPEFRVLLEGVDSITYGGKSGRGEGWSVEGKEVR